MATVLFCFVGVDVSFSGVTVDAVDVECADSDEVLPLGLMEPGSLDTLKRLGRRLRLFFSGAAGRWGRGAAKSGVGSRETGERSLSSGR